MRSPGVEEQRNVILEFLLPYPLGDDLRHPHLNMKNVWETGTYPGAAVLLFSLAMVIRVVVRRRSLPRERAAMAVVLVGCYLVAGGYLPGLGSFREATKARVIIAIGLVLCASVGFARAQATWRSRQHRSIWSPESLAALLLLAGAASFYVLLQLRSGALGKALLVGPPFDPVAFPAFQEAMKNPAIVVRMVTQSVAVAAGTLTLCLVVTLLSGRWRSRLIVGIAAAELLLVNGYCYYSRHSYGRITIPAELKEFVQKNDNGEELFRYSLHHTLANWSHLLPGLYETAGYDPIMPRDANNRTALLGLGGTEARPGAATTVSLAIGRRYDLALWDPASTLPLQVETDKTHFPGGSVVSLERDVVAGMVNDTMMGPSLEGTHWIMASASDTTLASQQERLPRQLRARVQDVVSARPTTSPQVKLLHIHAPEEFSFRVRQDTPSFLLLRVTWLPGWKVSVGGGRWHRPYCANRWAVAAYVPAGKHDVHFVYTPVGLYPSMVVAAFGVLAFGGLLYYRRGRRL